ncbi:MAG: hypothetical protein GY714_21870 [Desulfobacterales bacterium]|nr:hypothetical protein [Desulfobacterales bacterium]MCP4161751.1 hypothetical protein [Deltaproteobacteria bacterium]
MRNEKAETYTMENVSEIYDKPIDHYTILKNIVDRILPFKLGSLIVLDLGMVYYCFFHWEKRDLSNQEFSYHKKYQTILLLWVFIIMTPMEAIFVHILAEQWSITFAWICTSISLYTIIQLLGIINSIPNRPISIENGNLNLRYGLISETTIPISDISDLELNLKSIDCCDKIHNLSPFWHFEGHNVLINLKTKATLNRVYGFKTTYKAIAFHVDDKNSFIEALQLGI